MKAVTPQSPDPNRKVTGLTVSELVTVSVGMGCHRQVGWWRPRLPRRYRDRRVDPPVRNEAKVMEASSRTDFLTLSTFP